MNIALLFLGCAIWTLVTIIYCRFLRVKREKADFTELMESNKRLRLLQEVLDNPSKYLRK